MSSSPKWLPDPLCYSDYDGNWESFLKDVYEIFVRDFKANKVRFEGRTITFNSNLIKGKEEVFWHIIEREDKVSKSRIPDIKRSECINWIKPVIQNHKDDSVKVWKTKRRGEKRTFLWLEHLNYLVVLADKKQVAVLITAFHTDIGQYKKRLRREWKKHRKMQPPPKKDGA